MSVLLIDQIITDAFADSEPNWGAAMNQNLVRSGLLLARAVKSVGSNSPVAGVDNDRHIVGTAPTGAWAGKANQLARQNAATVGGWDFFALPDDIDVLNYANGNTYRKVAGLWVALTPPSADAFSYINPTNPTYNVPSDGVSDCLAAINAMLIAAPDGSCFMFPAGTYKISGTVSIPVGKHFRFYGAGKHKTTFLTTSATLDMFSVGDWQTTFENLSFHTSVVRSAGYAINFGANAECFVNSCEFLGMFNGVLINGTISGIDDCIFTNTVNFSVQYNGANVNGFITRTTFDCSPATVAHVEVNQCGSLLLSNCDIIHATNNLRVNPTSPNGCFAIYAVNTFFDTAAGSSVKVQGTGNVQRMKFVNCWLSGSVNGLEFASTAATLPTGIDLVNCDILSNSANGILANGVQDFSVVNSRIAGNVTAGVNVSASAAAVTEFLVSDCTVGPTGGIGGNGTGILVNAGTYGSYLVTGNIIDGNTTASITDNGTVAGFLQKVIKDNVGHSVSGQASATIAASAAISTTETVVAGGLNACPIPKNSVQVGDSWRITLLGACTSSAANNSTFRLRIGTAGTTADGVLASAVIAAALAGTAIGFRATIIFTVRSIGAAGTIAGSLILDNTGITGISTNQSSVIPLTVSPFNSTVDNYLEATYVSAAATTASTFQNGIMEKI